MSHLCVDFRTLVLLLFAIKGKWCLNLTAKGKTMTSKWIVMSVVTLGTVCLSVFGGTLTTNRWQAVEGDYNGSWGDARH